MGVKLKGKGFHMNNECFDNLRDTCTEIFNDSIVLIHLYSMLANKEQYDKKKTFICIA